MLILRESFRLGRKAIETVGRLFVQSEVLRHRHRAWRVGLSRQYQGPSLLQQLPGSDDASDESSDGETQLGKPRIGEDAQHLQGTECFDEDGNGELVKKKVLALQNMRRFRASRGPKS